LDFSGDAEMIKSVRAVVSGVVTTTGSSKLGSLLPSPPQLTNPKTRVEQKNIFTIGCIVITPSKRCRRGTSCKIGSRFQKCIQIDISPPFW
jgi:hypothetical protein